MSLPKKEFLIDHHRLNKKSSRYLKREQAYRSIKLWEKERDLATGLSLKIPNSR